MNIDNPCSLPLSQKMLIKLILNWQIYKKKLNEQREETETESIIYTLIHRRNDTGQISNASFSCCLINQKSLVVNKEHRFLLSLHKFRKQNECDLK